MCDGQYTSGSLLKNIAVLPGEAELPSQNWVSPLYGDWTSWPFRVYLGRVRRNI